MKIRYTMKILVVFIFFILFANSVFAQFSKGFSVSWGLKTTEILGDNPGVKTFAEWDPSKPALFGGGFNGPQQGMELLFIFPVDEKKNFEIPLGIDYTFYRALEHIPQTKFMHQELENSLDISSISIGLNYSLLKYSIANAKLYVGLEAKTSFVGKGVFTIITTYIDYDSVETLQSSPKESCIRLGGAITFGLEGEIAPQWFVNFNASFGILNLIGRNDERGELLTPFKNTPLYIENKESYVYTLHYALLIQYKL